MMHVDAPAPELRLHVAGALAQSQAARRSGGLVRLRARRAGRLQGQRLAGRRRLRPTNGFEDFEHISFWKTPTSQVQDARQPVRPVLQVGVRLHRRDRRPLIAGRLVDRPSASLAETCSRPGLRRSSNVYFIPGKPHPMTAAVSLREVSCVFRSAGKSVHAVDRVSLEIQPGEFFTLLGPSGSGKTTCLRMIARLRAAHQRQHLHLDGADVLGPPPYERDVNTVFQDYALFPHMNVRDNVAYGLMVRGVDRGSPRAPGPKRCWRLVQLPDATADRKPAQLSGGQRQRVALARALINEPKRAAARRAPGRPRPEAARANAERAQEPSSSKLGITFIFVTHDQEEALSMSDRIGGVQQGPDRADRHALRVLRPARHPLRRRVRRHVPMCCMARTPCAWARLAASHRSAPSRSNLSIGPEATRAQAVRCSRVGCIEVQFFGVVLARQRAAPGRRGRC